MQARAIHSRHVSDTKLSPITLPEAQFAATASTADPGTSRSQLSPAEDSLQQERNPGLQRRQAQLQQPEVFNLRPVFQASLPKFDENSTSGLFCVHLQRASQTQPWGLDMRAVATSEGRLYACSIKGDMPHLGLLQGDELVSVNGVRPRSTSMCREVLCRAESLALVFRRHDFCMDEAMSARSAICSCRRSSNLVAQLRPLLSATRPFNDHRRRHGAFTLVIRRHSAQVPFGLCFALQPRRPLLGAPSTLGEREEHPRSSPPLIEAEEHSQSNASVVVAGDLPHLGLRCGDQLLEINGTTPRSCVDCDRLMAADIGVCELYMKLFRWATYPDLALGLQDSLTEELEDQIVPMPEYKPMGTLCCSAPECLREQQQRQQQQR